MHRVGPRATRLRRPWRADRFLDPTNGAVSFRCGEPFSDTSTCFVRIRRPPARGLPDTAVEAHL